jgi:hypothetical protein
MHSMLFAALFQFAGTAHVVPLVRKMVVTQAHVTASDSNASVGAPVAAVMTAVMRCPAVKVFAAVAVAVAGTTLLTLIAPSPVTFVPAIWIATLKLPLPVK